MGLTVENIDILFKKSGLKNKQVEKLSHLVRKLFTEDDFPLILSAQNSPSIALNEVLSGFKAEKIIFIEISKQSKESGVYLNADHELLRKFIKSTSRDLKEKKFYVVSLDIELFICSDLDANIELIKALELSNDPDRLIALEIFGLSSFLDRKIDLEKLLPKIVNAFLKKPIWKKLKELSA